jgi:para-nitrobenzyl esterase
MVFVHGGAFEWGSGTFGIYDGAKLALATGNIIVTTNYRLGALGFLSLPALRTEDASHPSAGNYAIEDQAAAFQWVKSNVGAFGGDTSNVTIFGESAGGTSMLAHLASPKSQGLFDRVIIESAWSPYGSASIAQSTADSYGASFATALGCTSTDATSLLTCLRAASVSAVLGAVVDKGGGVQASAGVDWLPVVDQFVLPGDPITLIASGAFNQVPAILGNNANEGSLFELQVSPTSDATYAADEETQFPGNGPAVVAQYPPSAYGGSYTGAGAAAMTDGTFVCPARRVARGMAMAGVAAYRYEFTHAIDFPLGGLGAFHGSELLFVFGNEIQGTTLATGEIPLSQQMMGYWGAMATTGNPNGGGRLAWPEYATPAEAQIDLDLSLSTVSQFEKTACDFWDGL